jgi:hypothetical protein
LNLDRVTTIISQTEMERRFNGSNTRQRRVALLRRRDGDLCYYCKVLLDFTRVNGTLNDNTVTIEHVHPLGDGGTNEMDNGMQLLQRVSESTQ